MVQRTFLNCALSLQLLYPVGNRGLKVLRVGRGICWGHANVDMYGLTLLFCCTKGAARGRKFAIVQFFTNALAALFPNFG